MPRAGGYGCAQDTWGSTAEADTITCAHCQRVVFLNAERDLPPRLITLRPEYKDMGGFCRLCMKSICGPCCDKGSCTPWEKALERQLAVAMVRRSYLECS